VISAVFDERWQAYAGTIVRITHPQLGSLEVRPTAPGATLGDFPGPAGRTIHIMTAQNPGAPLPEQENRARQAELVAVVGAMADVEAWSALGGDPSWVHSEDSLAIIGLSEAEAVALARRYDQDAIFAWTSDEWILISCRSDQRQSAGWQLLHRE
jgi:hypothetical protein